MSATLEMRRAERFLIASLLAALAVILVAHAVPLLNAPVMARQLKTQRELLKGLVQYERLLDSLDESLRAVILSPERPELRSRELEARQAVLKQLDVLAESAPVEGPIPLDLIDLATHFRRHVVSEADDVKRNVGAPGNWALGRFRGRYARARAEHSALVQDLVNRAGLISDTALASSQRRLLASAGVLILLWGGTLTFVTVRARVRPDSLLILPPSPEPGRGHASEDHADTRDGATSSHDTILAGASSDTPADDASLASEPEPAPVVLELSTTDLKVGVPGAAPGSAEAEVPARPPEPEAPATPSAPATEPTRPADRAPEVKPPAEPATEASGTPEAGGAGEVIDLGALFAEEAQKEQAPVSSPAPEAATTSAAIAEPVAPAAQAPETEEAVVFDLGAPPPPDPEPAVSPAPLATASPEVESVRPESLAAAPVLEPPPAPPQEAVVPVAADPPGADTASPPTQPQTQARPQAQTPPEVPRAEAADPSLVSSASLAPQSLESVGQSSSAAAEVGATVLPEAVAAPEVAAAPAEMPPSPGVPEAAPPPPVAAEPVAPPVVSPTVDPVPAAASEPVPVPSEKTESEAVRPPAAATESGPSSLPAPEGPTAAPTPSTVVPTASAAAAPPSATPGAQPPASAPDKAAAAASRPKPDMRALMKDAKVMTADQLTAMLFGRGSAAGGKSQAASTDAAAAPSQPAPAPAADPVSPPRTITGVEMGKNADAADGGDTKLDLSF